MFLRILLGLQTGCMALRYTARKIFHCVVGWKPFSSVWFALIFNEVWAKEAFRAGCVLSVPHRPQSDRDMQG